MGFDIFQEIVTIASGISVIIGCLCLIIKPIRTRLFEDKEFKEAMIETQKDLLRNQMTQIYYKYKDKKQIPQYEYESFLKMYHSYEVYHGNSFIKILKTQMESWTVLPN